VRNTSGEFLSLYKIKSGPSKGKIEEKKTSVWEETKSDSRKGRIRIVFQKDKDSEERKEVEEVVKEIIRIS